MIDIEKRRARNRRWCWRQKIKKFGWQAAEADMTGRGRHAVGAANGNSREARAKRKALAVEATAND
jgi:hypothetical protein